MISSIASFTSFLTWVAQWLHLFRFLRVLRSAVFVSYVMCFHSNDPLLLNFPLGCTSFIQVLSSLVSISEIQWIPVSLQPAATIACHRCPLLMSAMAMSFSLFPRLVDPPVMLKSLPMSPVIHSTILPSMVPSHIGFSVCSSTAVDDGAISSDLLIADAAIFPTSPPEFACFIHATVLSMLISSQKFTHSIPHLFLLVHITSFGIVRTILPFSLYVRLYIVWILSIESFPVLLCRMRWSIRGTSAILTNCINSPPVHLFDAIFPSLSSHSSFICLNDSSTSFDIAVNHPRYLTLSSGPSSWHPSTRSESSLL